MWKTLKNIVKLNKQDILIEGAVYGGVFLFGLMIFFIIAAIDRDIAGLPLGSLLTWIGYVVMSLIGGTLLVMQSFNLMVSMGITRSHFIMAYGMYRFLFQFGFLIIFKVLLLLEEMLQRVFVTEEVFVEEFTNMTFSIPMLAIYAAALVIIQFFCGSMILRYAKKALIVFWFIWMSGCFGIGPIMDVFSQSMEERSIAGRLLIAVVDGVKMMGPFGWEIVAGVIALLLVLVTVVSMRKQWVSL